MKCIGEMLNPDKYGFLGTIAVLENKEAIMKVFGLKNEKWLNVWNIDSRILTLFYKSYEAEIDWFIVVYDYPAFCSEPEVKEAIIWHELGHIDYPVYENQMNVESEIQCDRLASKKGHREGMRKVLDMTLRMALSLNHDLLKKITTERHLKLLG